MGQGHAQGLDCHGCLSSKVGNKHAAVAGVQTHRMSGKSQLGSPDAAGARQLYALAEVCTASPGLTDIRTR